MIDVPDGGRLHYEIAGEGPVVTLIHPGLWDMRTWDREFAAFSDAGYRALRYDVRGYGRSSRPEPGVSYSHVRDLHALLEAEDVTQTAIVGCSMGGGIDLDYALEHPERVWGLVLVASGREDVAQTISGRTMRVTGLPLRYRVPSRLTGVSSSLLGSVCRSGETL